jgi:RHS repeat-associated protein
MKNGKGGQSATTKKPVGALLCGLLCLGAPALGATTVTKITYDAGDRVVSVTDPRNLVTTYTYDGLGQLWQQAGPDTGTTSYGYDAYGRRTSMTRADGTVTGYGYDTLNRPTSVTAGGLTQLATYDSCTNGLDRLCTASDSTGSTSYTYTPEGWLAGRGFSIAGTTYALGYGYDPMGHLATVNYPDGHEATYSYADGVVSGVTLNIGGNSVAGASAVSYRPGDLAMAGWTSSNGLSNTLGYDSDGRLTGISVPNVQSLAIGYDKADRIASITNSIDPGQSAGFDYDDQSRLTGAYGVADTESYAYDLDGNRIGQTVNGASTSFNINATSNRLMGVSGATTMTYGYDAQGNTTAVNGATVNQYNPFNRLSSASGASDYVNPQGHRLRKVSSAGTTYFAPEGGALLAENDNGTWIDYVWLNGRLIGRVSGSTVGAIHDDQTGRPQVVTDAGGAVVWKANNYPFTQAVTLNNIGGLNLGFPGQYYDAERGTWNNGFRDYDSSLGRYIESDPFGLVGGINTYAYVNNNPLVGVDPRGLATAVIVGGAAGWNFAGHVAIAFTGQGVYSYGTGTPFGSSLTAYLASQAAYRSSAVYILNTTPEQEQRMSAYLNGNYSPQSGQRYSIFNHDCGTAVNGALGSVGIGDDAIVGAAQAGGIMLPQLPSTAGFIGSTYPGASVIEVPQGAAVPGSLSSFNPSVH